MAWHRDSITDGELDALCEAASRAWADDTRLARFVGTAPSDGQCYVTAKWLASRLGGHVGVRQGHFAWLSSDKHYYIDLTGDHTGVVVYSKNDDFEYQPYVQAVDNDRTARFIKRANRIFDNLDRLLHTADLGGDAFPAEEPQASSDREQSTNTYWHDEPAQDPAQGVYQFIYGNGQLEVSPNHTHDELAGHARVPANHTGPFAAGHITVTNGKATFDVDTNVNVNALFRIFKDYCKQVGWQWGGLTNADGEPISDEFAPKKAQTLNWIYDPEADHLALGRVSHSELLLAPETSGSSETRVGLVVGRARIVKGRAYISPVEPASLAALSEWAEDSGLVLYGSRESGNDNVYKRIEDLDVENTGANSEAPFEKRVDERDPSGVYRCPSCQRLFPNWDVYQRHRRDDEGEGDVVEDGGFPELDMDKPAPFQPHFTPKQPEVMPVSSVREAKRVDGFDKYASVFGYLHDEDHHTYYVAYVNGSPVGYAAVRDDNHVTMIHSAVKRQGVARAILFKLMRHYPSLTTNISYDWEGPMLRQAGWIHARGHHFYRWAAGQDPSSTLEASVPFIYDVQEDSVFIGHPGARTSDIPGRFTPGGIVEGEYEPGGKVFLRSMTSIPYTVRHLIELWYYQHPELEVKSVHLRDDAGKDTRLASDKLALVNTLANLRTLAFADPAVYVAHRVLTEDDGGRVFLVGGAVRDALMGKEPKDFDLMVTGVPSEKVARSLSTQPGHMDYTGKDFGVFRYTHKSGSQVEVALPRRERSTGAAHQDFDVEADYTMKPEDDLHRRDFTVNAMALDLTTGELIDPFGGAADIASGTLRATSDTTLSEDPLRVLRGVVLHARYGLEPDEATRVQMSHNAHSLVNLPADRIQWELDKVLAAPRPAVGIRFAHDTGVLKHILPEVDSAFGYDQKNPHHAHDLGTHLMQVLGRMAAMTDDLDLRYAALLHDIGKPASAWWHPADGRCKYYMHIASADIVGADEDGNPLTIKEGTAVGQNHHDVGAVMAQRRLTELRFPNHRIIRITCLIEHHMWTPFETVRGARKFLSRVGRHADDLLLFRVADQDGKGVEAIADGRTPDGIKKQANLVDRVRNEQQPTKQADLAINGNDLLARGMVEGPKVGQVLSHLTAKVIDDPELNTRDELFKLADDFTAA